MKKISLFLVLFLAVLSFNSTAQSADFYSGKWEMMIVGTPNGDAKFVMEMKRVEGKLTGDLSDPTGTIAEKIPLTSIEEDGDKITVYFSVSGYDVNVALTKVDEDNLKGSLMEMFETTAKRIKQ